MIISRDSIAELAQADRAIIEQLFPELPTVDLFDEWFGFEPSRVRIWPVLEGVDLPYMHFHHAHELPSVGISDHRHWLVFGMADNIGQVGTPTVKGLPSLSIWNLEYNAGEYFAAIAGQVTESRRFDLTKLGVLGDAARLHRVQVERWVHVSRTIMEDALSVLAFCTEAYRRTHPALDRPTSEWSNADWQTNFTQRELDQLYVSVRDGRVITHPKYPMIIPEGYEQMDLSQLVARMPEQLQPLIEYRGLICSKLASRQQELLDSLAPLWWRWQVLEAMLWSALLDRPVPSFVEIKEYVERVSDSRPPVEDSNWLQVGKGKDRTPARLVPFLANAILNNSGLFASGSLQDKREAWQRECERHLEARLYLERCIAQPRTLNDKSFRQHLLNADELIQQMTREKGR